MWFIHSLRKSVWDRAPSHILSQMLRRVTVWVEDRRWERAFRSSLRDNTWFHRAMSSEILFGEGEGQDGEQGDWRRLCGLKTRARYGDDRSLRALGDHGGRQKLRWACEPQRGNDGDKSTAVPHGEENESDWRVEPLQTARQEVPAGGQKAPVRVGFGHRAVGYLAHGVTRWAVPGGVPAGE